MRPGDPQTIGSLGELGFLARLLPTLRGGRGVLVGPGDDTAVVVSPTRRLLVTTDALVEGVHFRRGWLRPVQIGRKAYLASASDIAAMGGRPRFCLASIGVAPDFPSRDLAALHRGLGAAARETGARLVGGNLTRARELLVSVTLIGESPPRPALRSGARPGDLLYVTGTLGEAALGLEMLRRNAGARGEPVRRFREPPKRLRAGALLARSGYASAMVDVSDGLLQDLGHLCRASGVGARIEACLLPASPSVRRAGLSLLLAGGEDYELLCAVPARRQERVERLERRLGCRLTLIGSCVPARHGVRVLDERGRSLGDGRAGFDHFAAARRP
jgi:thiamine-monophosphate kinase